MLIELAPVLLAHVLQAPAVTVSIAVDPGADRHPISPLIYGVNFGDDAQAAARHWPSRRWGGNGTTRYSWQDDIANHASDWFFYNIEPQADPGTLPDGSTADLFVDATRVTRRQMAAFLLRANHGSTYVPPAATGIFGDVPVGDPFAPWIEELKAEQVTGGCQAAPLLYCPDNPNTRGQVAVFLVKTFVLP